MQGVNFVNRAIALCEGRGAVLDIGCGTGSKILEKLLAEGFHATGIDISNEMLKIAKERYPAVEFVRADIGEWIPSKKFQIVVAWDSIFHLCHENHRSVIEKMCAILNDGGVMLFTAGGIDGEIEGSVFGERFTYSSLADTSLLDIIKQCGCVPVLMERDQYPLHHLVVIAIKAQQHAV